MNIDEFLLKLVDDGYELKNMAFEEDENEFVRLLSQINSDLAIAISSSFFNENIALFSNLPKINYIHSVISLPIFNESSNLVLVILNPLKRSDKFLLIDESDSLVHKNNDYNFSYIEDELALDLFNSINNFKDSDNAICLKLNTIFDDNEIHDDILDLMEPKNDSSAIKRKVLSNDVHDDILELMDQKTEVDREHDDILDLKQDRFNPIKKRILSNSLVDDILSLREKRSVRQEIERHNTISVENVSIDVTSANLLTELMYTKKRQNPENLLKKNNKPLIDGEVKFRKLGKIADLHNIDEKNTDNTILIATCKRCDSRLVFYNNDINDFNGEIFVEISNISDEVSLDYLYEYLNSDNGKEELLYFSNGYNYIRAQFINPIEIPIPSLEVQKEIVKATREAREFFKTVDLLKNEFNSNILDYKHISRSIKDLKGDIEIDSKTSEVTRLSGSWRHAYQGLIWPLAISYLSATKGGFELVEKKDNYIKLFEFTTAFNAIILLSGLPEDVYLKNFEKIWNARSLNEYKSMTFGKWIVLSKNLAEVYNNNNFTSKLDEEFFDKIKSNVLLDYLNESKDYRNKEFHEAMSNAYEAEKTIEILDGFLEEVFDILDVYSNYKFIYTTGKLEVHKQSFIHEVILLNGPCAQPIYDKIIFDNVLMSESLYLYNPKNNKKLLIKDNLMKFKAVDRNKKHWALFIYNSCDKNENNAFYKCFQSKEKNHRERISSLRQDVLL